MGDILKSVAYDHPHFTIEREANLGVVQAPSVSLTDFAHFRCRNKAVVTHVMVNCTSVPSAMTAFSLQVMRGATTIAALTLSSYSVVGDAQLSAKVMTLGVASTTLASIGASMSLEMDGNEKGKFNVVWVYRFLP